jgi:copper resistance protein D
MSGLIVALRFVHFAAVVALFGELAFLVWTARADSRAAPSEEPALRREAMRVAAWCLGLVVASGAPWLAVQAAEMSGLPLARALDRETLGAVLSETLFGRTWTVRLVIAAALGATLFFARRKTGGAALDRTCALLAGCLLATLAWAGHAAAEQGADRLVHLGSDALHLLAAGAWLGALWPLARLLAHARRAADASALAFAARVTRRFSILGVVSVGALILTGAANAWYLLGSVPALFGTGYGRLLLAKLALFAAMVAFAARNRLRWTPDLRAASGECAPLALRNLGRNAIAETSLGLALLGIVAALGVTVPALHVQTVWPFPYTISDWRIVPAHPSTYFRSPVRYSAGSIARGEPLYRRYCGACHGAEGHGDGPAAASLPVRPPDLSEHWYHHREGDLLWWLQHGIAGTAMPGFGARIGDDRLWDLLNFLRAQTDADYAKEIDSGVGEWRPIAAPDFEFQIGERPQESLQGVRGQGVALLVFYAHPEADGRLRALESAQAELRRAGVRVLAMQVKGAPVPAGAHAAGGSMITDPDSQVAAAYALFRGTSAPGIADEVEFLVDREGYLRARWTPGETPDWSRISELLAQVAILNRESPHTHSGGEHAHGAHVH